MNWTADDWKRAIFSDESQFVIEDPKRIKLWKNTTIISTTPQVRKRAYVSWYGGALQETVLAL